MRGTGRNTGERDRCREGSVGQQKEKPENCKGKQLTSLPGMPVALQETAAVYQVRFFFFLNGSGRLGMRSVLLICYVC